MSAWSSPVVLNLVIPFIKAALEHKRCTIDKAASNNQELTNVTTVVLL